MANNSWTTNKLNINGITPQSDPISLHFSDNAKVAFGDSVEIIFKIGNGKCDCCKKESSKNILEIQLTEQFKRSLCFFCIFENIDKNFNTGKSIEMERALYEEEK